MKSLNPFRKISFNPDPFILLAILVTAFLFRFAGIGVGLPDTPDPRESLIAEDILNLINLTSPPQIYNWPGTAWFYLIALISKFLSIFGLNLTEGRVIWIARFVNVLLGTGTIWFIYQLGKTCYNIRIGEISAGFLAVAMLHATNESRFAIVDIPATFCVTLFLWLALKDSLLNYRRCLFLGIVFGIGFAVKFPTVFVLGSLLIYFRTPNYFRKILLIVCVAAITFTVICPYWIIDLMSPQWNLFFEDFWYESHHYNQGHFGLFAAAETGLLQRFLYLGPLLGWGMGLPLALLVCLSVIVESVRYILSILNIRKVNLKNLGGIDQKSHQQETETTTLNLMSFPIHLTQLGLLAFIIPYLLFIGSYKVTFSRHLLILYPSLIVLSSVLLYSLNKRIVIVIGSIVWISSFVYTGAFATVMWSQPTGQEASEWISANISIETEITRPPEILFDWLIPELDRDLIVGESDWILITQPDMEVFEKYAKFPNNYKRKDWFPLEVLEINETVQFYRDILEKDSGYELYKTFYRSPQFLGIKFSDKDSPFPMRALLHPEIYLYRRIQK